MQSMKMLLLLTMLCIPVISALELKKVEPVVMKAVRGMEARLPCGLGKLFLDGPKSNVIWLKNDVEYLYQYPNEEFEKRRLMLDYMSGTVCESSFCRDNTSLVIKKAGDRDQGLYRCRIHYQTSPSVDFVIDLKIVEFPGLPRIYDVSGERLNKGFVGPFPLGADLTLVCEVDDNPELDLYWRRNGVLAEACYTSRPNKLRVDIHLPNLSRGDLNAHYECVLQISDVSEPVSASVNVKMYLPPMSVEIRLDDNYDFEAGQPRVVDCVVVGCVPPPAIIWTLGSKMIRPSVHKELRDGNYTVSSLTLAPSRHNHRNELVCRAYNAHMPNSLFQDKVTVNVGYRPTCQVGRDEVIGAVVHEVETVKCVVDADPAPLKFEWTFANSKTLYTNFSKTDNNGYTSTMSWLPREDDFGMLTCRAINAFGGQKIPCTYNIISGGPPELPNCTVRRIYPNSLRVQCVKGWDGGRPLRMHLDIVDEKGTCIKNVTDNAGHFFIPNIVQRKNITAILYACNSRGKSKQRTIYLHTLPAMSEAGNNYIGGEWIPYLEALAAAVALGIAASSITLGYKILMARREPVDVFNMDIVAHTDVIPHSYNYAEIFQPF